MAGETLDGGKELSVWDPERPDVRDLLLSADITQCELLPWGSNYTFVLTLEASGAGSSLAVYKPRRGEAPLYDFPGGTLYQREYAAYLVSRSLGWCFIPPTVIRDGPYGIGSVQLFIPSQPDANYFTFRQQRAEDLKRFAAFDALANNADRKGGHCLVDTRSNKLWGIDHGLTFHSVPKLRTVIWDFQSTPVPEKLLGDMELLLRKLEGQNPDLAELADLLSPTELRALCQRLDQLLTVRRYPEPGPWRSIPWPRI